MAAELKFNRRASTKAVLKSMSCEPVIVHSERTMRRPVKPKPKPPHAFVLEALAPANPEVRRMSSGFAVYLGNRIVFPSIRSIGLLGDKICHWLLIPSDSPGFETEALHACDLLLHRDPRLGRIPQSRR
jgi:hypothetical protein